MTSPVLNNLIDKLDHSLEIYNGKVKINDHARLQEKIYTLVEVSTLEKGVSQGMARYLTRLAALASGIIPSSIQDLYIARGNGTVPSTFTVPAINLRALSYDAARAVFRAALSMDAASIIFEIARSEIGYTDQRPSEYATNVLSAAIQEGFIGPVFIQGDHFQVSAKRYASDSGSELKAVRDLSKEAIAAGFFNIDIDTSTLVDLTKPNIVKQQELNASISAQLTAYIRSIEPTGITISVGGEIGEVGGKNSTEEELRAYMEGYDAALDKLDSKATGISKISIQTGTTHGGVVLPDGTIAHVNVDFDTLKHLSRVSREVYGLGGAVQHGASTLSEDAFGKFVEYEACEVHLATNFQNMLFDRLPADLINEMYVYLDENNASERKPNMTDEQFYYKTRKNVIGPFKTKLWNLPTEKREEIRVAWEAQFCKLFRLFGVTHTRKYIDQTIKPVVIMPSIKDYLGDESTEEMVLDLAD